MSMNGNGKKLSVGLIGAGMIGQFRAQGLAQVPSIRVAAVADMNLTLAQAAAKMAGTDRAVADGRELFADPSIDAIILSTPPNSHQKLGVAALQAGKHLFVEKPLAMNVAECEAIVAAGEATGRSVATGFNMRFTRAAELARKIIASGGIGKLDHIRSFHGHSGGKEFTHPWICNAEISGGGTLMDNGIHLIDLTRSFLGEVKDIAGFSSDFVWQLKNAEDNGFLLLRNTDNRVATLQSSWTEWRGYGYRLEIYGTEGYLRFGYPPLMLTHGRKDKNGKVTVKRHMFPVYQVLERMKGWQFGLLETLVRELDAWAGALLSGAAVPVSGRDGLEAVRIAKSAVNGHVGS
jgi:predicted dehydrogenase